MFIAALPLLLPQVDQEPAPTRPAPPDGFRLLAQDDRFDVHGGPGAEAFVAPVLEVAHRGLALTQDALGDELADERRFQIWIDSDIAAALASEALESEAASDTDGDNIETSVPKPIEWGTVSHWLPHFWYAAYNEGRDLLAVRPGFGGRHELLELHGLHPATELSIAQASIEMTMRALGVEDRERPIWLASGVHKALAGLVADGHDSLPKAWDQVLTRHRHHGFLSGWGRYFPDDDPCPNPVDLLRGHFTGSAWEDSGLGWNVSNLLVDYVFSDPNSRNLRGGLGQLLRCSDLNEFAELVDSLISKRLVKRIEEGFVDWLDDRPEHINFLYLGVREDRHDRHALVAGHDRAGRVLLEPPGYRPPLELRVELDWLAGDEVEVGVLIEKDDGSAEKTLLALRVTRELQPFVVVHGADWTGRQIENAVPRVEPIGEPLSRRPRRLSIELDAETVVLVADRRRVMFDLARWSGLPNDRESWFDFDLRGLIVAIAPLGVVEVAIEVER